MAAIAIIWDLDAAIDGDKEGELKHRLELHKGKVQAVAFSSCSTYLSTLGGQDDNSLVVWGTDDGKAICGTSAHTDSAKAMCWYNTCSDRLVTCGNNHVIVWKFEKKSRKLIKHKAQMNKIVRTMTCVTMPQDDRCVLAGNTTGEVMRFNNTETEVFEPRFLDMAAARFKCGVTCLTTIQNSDGSFDCLVGSGDGRVTRIRQWKAKSHGRNPSQPVMGAVTSIAVRLMSPDIVFAGTAQGNTYLLPSTCTEEPELRGTCHSSAINDICFPGECSDLFLTCGMNDIRIWNTESRQELLRIQVPNLECNCIHVTPNGGTIVSGWDDGKIRGFKPESGALKFVVQDAHSESCTAVKCFNEDDHGSWKMVSGGQDGRVRVWEIMQGKQKMLTSLKEHRDAISAIQIVADNNLCLTSSLDGSCICWDLVNFTRVRAMFNNTQFLDIKLHPDESQMLTCGTDRKITYWDSTDGDPIRVMEGSDPGNAGGAVTSLDIVGEGQVYVSGSKDRLVKLWHYDEGECTHVGTGHSGDITAVRIAPDERKIISIGAEGAIMVWSMPDLSSYDE